MYGDLSSALESRRHREAAEELDPSIYDYDAVYESLKPEKKVITREREEEGDEYAGTEKFVTEAYKKQQEENRRIEAEERQREEEESRKNQAGGMTAFYRDLLDKGDRRHAEIVKAAEEGAKSGPKLEGEAQKEEKTKTDADVAREINERGGTIAINEDGQVVDKRELLRGGLNLSAKKKSETPKNMQRGLDRGGERGPSRGFIGHGGKQAMRERQSRMLEAQLEQTLKRSLEQEEEERRQVERATKSRKTEADISNAKERYLARKRQAEEKKKGLAAD
ncbi:hypothetical protein ONZ43_g2934 [Nemania bipapillata]|uniref:Uncharacterized protein n=1 Tax=Nemania bipapillata TaxID=110536 RepID=A0ACC2IYT6_9PEZI|nr:hypothetical protein ONZ43_g2934 [Nemania bipapillata]